MVSIDSLTSENMLKSAFSLNIDKSVSAFDIRKVQFVGQNAEKGPF